MSSVCVCVYSKDLRPLFLAWSLGLHGIQVLDSRHIRTGPILQIQESTGEYSDDQTWQAFRKHQKKLKLAKKSVGWKSASDEAAVSARARGYSLLHSDWQIQTWAQLRFEGLSWVHTLFLNMWGEEYYIIDNSKNFCQPYFYSNILWLCFIKMQRFCHCHN